MALGVVRLFDLLTVFWTVLADYRAIFGLIPLIEPTGDNKYDEKTRFESDQDLFFFQTGKISFHIKKVGQSFVCLYFGLIAST